MMQLANGRNRWAARPALVRLLKFVALSAALHAAALQLMIPLRNPGQPQGYLIRAELIDPVPVAAQQAAVTQPPAAPPPARSPQAPRAELPKAPRAESSQAPRAESSQAPRAELPQAPRAEPPRAPRAEEPQAAPTATAQAAAETPAPAEPPAPTPVEAPATPAPEVAADAEPMPVAEAPAADAPRAEAAPLPVVEPASVPAAAPTLPAASVQVAAPVREIVVARADEAQLTQRATAGFALRHPDISATPRITAPPPKSALPPAAGPAEPTVTTAKPAEASATAAVPAEPTSVAAISAVPAEQPTPVPPPASAEASPASAAAQAKQVPVIVARSASSSSTSGSALPTLTLPPRAQAPSPTAQAPSPTAQAASPSAPGQAAAVREVAVIKAQAAAPVVTPTLTLPPRQLSPRAEVQRRAASDGSAGVAPAPAPPPSAPVAAPAPAPALPTAPPAASSTAPPIAPSPAPPAANAAVSAPPATTTTTPPPAAGPSVDDVLPQPVPAPQQVAALAHSLPVPLRFESTEAALAALPKSARIEYVFRRGERGLNLGKLKLHWQLDGAQYSVRSEGETTGIFAIFFQGKHRMESRGSVTSQGLMPEFFQEERNYKGRRLEQVAFDRANKALVYSNEKDTRSAPLAEGTQDILSILFQFALDPPKSGRFTSTFTTARKLETFEYEVSAQETLELAGKRVETIRLTPKDARGRASIEVWLAVNDHHLPVKVRFVDRKGNITEQIATNIRFE